jgi:arylsulfatase A-like enzyme
MVTAVDAAIGQVLGALAQRGMLDRTIVVFHANTGGAVKRKYSIGDGDTPANVASNGPYRGGHGGLHEGGVRAVALVWRPGEVPPGTTTELIHAVDLYPTLLNLAGALTEQTKPVDGLDMWPTIAQGKPSPRKEVLLNVEEFRGALRTGDWKLIHQATLPASFELYNLRADPSEEDNQAEREPERVQTMLRRLTEYAWQMAPASYLEALAKPRKVEVPIYWGENPTRP